MTTRIQHIKMCAGDAQMAYNFFAALEGMFESVGILKTTDTGQLDFSSGPSGIPYPGSIPLNTIVALGYTIRRLHRVGFPDLYLRLDYRIRNWAGTAGMDPPTGWGWNVYTLRVPDWFLTVSTSTDGAGNLTGTKSSHLLRNVDYYSGAVSGIPANTSLIRSDLFSYPVYITSDGANNIGICIDPTQLKQIAGNQIRGFSDWSWYIERTVDATNGQYTANGFSFIDTSNGNNVLAAGVAVSGNINPSMPYQGIIKYSPIRNSNSMFTSSMLGGPTLMYPIGVRIPKRMGSMKGAFVYHASDMPGGAIFQMQVYGETRTFLSTGNYNNARLHPTATDYRLAMLWE